MNPLDYVVDCLYIISGERLSTEYSPSPIETLSQTLSANTEAVLAEFLSPMGFVLLPGIWKVKLVMQGTGNQSTKFALYRIEVLQNGERVAITEYQTLPTSFQSLATEIYLPGHRYTDLLTLKVWIKNSHTNSHTNTFNLQVNLSSSFMKN
jgi:hypothetical protein